MPWSTSHLSRLRSARAPDLQICLRMNFKSSLLNLVVTPFTDIALLLIMLIGLYRLRGHGSSTFGMIKVLWRQGAFWLLVAILAEIPPVVFIFLDLNASFDVMFVLPSWLSMVIAATRLHRSLVDFASSPPDVSHGNLQSSRNPVRKTKRINAASIPMNGMEVAVHIVSEQDGTPRMRDDAIDDAR